MSGRSNYLVLLVALTLVFAWSAIASHDRVAWFLEVSGSAAAAFLATQGDIWDTQWDMLLAILGAMAALILLFDKHDCSIGRLGLVR